MKRQFEAKFIQNDTVWRKRITIQSDALAQANQRIRELEEALANFTSKR